MDNLKETLVHVRGYAFILLVTVIVAGFTHNRAIEEELVGQVPDDGKEGTP